MYIVATENIAQAIAGIRKTFPNMDGLDNEEDAKLFVIERILRALDWDLYDPKEIKKEFQVDKDKVDYALYPNWPTAAVFIEAKKPAVNLENYQSQLLKYCFQQAVNLAVLTNGRTWWMYLPKYDGPQGEGLHWSKKRFSAIDITNGKPSSLQTEFERFLSKEKVSSGEAVESAKSRIDDRHKADRAQKGMMEAWNDLVATPSEDLIKLLTESTFQVCNVKPGKPEVKKFLQNHRAQFRVSDTVPTKGSAVIREGISRQNGKPSKFMFLDEPHSVKTWKEVLVRLCELIYVEKPDDFDHIISIQGTKNMYFSRNLDDLKSPEPIGDSGIFAATDLSSSGVKDRCQKVLQAFGYPKDFFRIG